MTYLDITNINTVQLNVREHVINFARIFIANCPRSYTSFQARVYYYYLSIPSETYLTQNQTHNLFDPHGVVLAFLHHETNLWDSDGIIDCFEASWVRV